MSIPDAITTPVTPKDQNGDPIQSGRWYLARLGRGKPVLLEVREDLDECELLCRPKDGERWQRVNEMDSQAQWELIDPKDFDL